MESRQYNNLSKDLSFVQKDISTNQEKFLDISPVRFNSNAMKRPASSSYIKTNKVRQSSNQIKNLKKLNVNVSVNYNNQDNDTLPQINSSIANTTMTPISSKYNMNSVNLALNADKFARKKMFPQEKFKIVKTKQQAPEKENVLIDENIKLRQTVSKLQAEVNSYKNEFVKSQTDLKKREHFFEELMSSEKNEKLFGFSLDKISDNHSFYQLNSQAKEHVLIKNIRGKFKEKLREIKAKEEEIEKLKQHLKFTKINEVTIENLTLNEEILRLQDLYDKLLIESSINGKDHKEIEILHASMTNQYKIIESTQQHVEELREENNEKTIKIKSIKEKNKNLKKELVLEKMKNKSETHAYVSERKCLCVEKDNELNEVKSLSSKIKSQLKEKEKLIEEYEESNDKILNEKNTQINQLKVKLDEISSELSANVDLTRRKEKEIWELTNSIEMILERERNIIKHKNEYDFLIGSQISFSVYNILKALEIESHDSFSVYKILKALEIESHDSFSVYRIQKIHEIESHTSFSVHKIKKTFEIEPHTSFSVSKIHKTLEIAQNEPSFNIINDFDIITHLQIKILEIRNVDYYILEKKIFSQFENEEESITNLVEDITTSMTEILNLHTINDRFIINSWIYHVIKENSSKTLHEFKQKFFDIFSSLKIRSKEEKTSNNTILKKILSPLHLNLYRELIKKDKNLEGYLSILEIKEIFKALKISLDFEMNGDLTYLLKMNNDQSLYNLKYLNLLNLLCEEDAVEILEIKAVKSLENINYEYIQSISVCVSDSQRSIVNVSHDDLSELINISEKDKDSMSIKSYSSMSNSHRSKASVMILSDNIVNREHPINADRERSKSVLLENLNYELYYRTRSNSTQIVNDAFTKALKDYRFTREKEVDMQVLEMKEDEKEFKTSSETFVEEIFKKTIINFKNRISLDNDTENHVEEEKSCPVNFENTTPIKQMRSIKEEEEIEE